MEGRDGKRRENISAWQTILAQDQLGTICWSVCGGWALALSLTDWRSQPPIHCIQVGCMRDSGDQDVYLTRHTWVRLSHPSSALNSVATERLWKFSIGIYLTERRKRSSHKETLPPSFFLLPALTQDWSLAHLPKGLLCSSDFLMDSRTILFPVVHSVIQQWHLGPNLK